MEEDPQSLRLAFRDGDCFDFTPEPAVTIPVQDPRVLRRLAVGDMYSLGDASVAVNLAADGAWHRWRH